jgi:hypothetical protein
MTTGVHGLPELHNFKECISRVTLQDTTERHLTATSTSFMSCNSRLYHAYIYGGGTWWHSGLGTMLQAGRSRLKPIK